VRVDEADDARQRFDVRIAPDAGVLRADAPLRKHRRRLDEDDAGAADRPAAEVDEVPVVQQAVPARILAHRRDRDAAGEGDRPECQGLEQIRQVSALSVLANAGWKTCLILSYLARAFVPEKSEPAAEQRRTSSDDWRVLE
jgi:hypothetical protein